MDATTSMRWAYSSNLPQGGSLTRNDFDLDLIPDILCDPKDQELLSGATRRHNHLETDQIPLHFVTDATGPAV